MNLVEDCLNKVKKDCYKFIKKQETSSDKFENKDKMLKDYLVPMSFWIAKKTNFKKPYIVGLTGGQGTCLLYTSPSPRDISGSRMPSSA